MYIIPIYFKKLFEDDPYELYNIYDSEIDIATEMLAELAAAANSITENKGKI